MIRRYMDLLTFFHPENLLADKNQLFPCLGKEGIEMIGFVWALLIGNNERQKCLNIDFRNSNMKIHSS